MDEIDSPELAAKPNKRLKTGAVSGIIGYRLRRAQLHIFHRFIASFAELNLRPAEYSVLVLIADNPGSKQTDIAHALGIKRANFVALINGLEGRGLTERRRPVGDRRSNALFLTPEGEQFVTRANRVQAEFEADCIARLGGEKQRDQFMALLDTLIAN